MKIHHPRTVWRVERGNRIFLPKRKKTIFSATHIIWNPHGRGRSAGSEESTKWRTWETRHALSPPPPSSESDPSMPGPCDVVVDVDVGVDAKSRGSRR
jgi:hypothetical protein